MLGTIRYVLFLIIFLVGLGFALLNVGLVPLNLYVGSWQLPLSLALVMAMALGALGAFIACLAQFLKLKREINKLRKAAKLSEIELMNLRALPLKELG